ARADVDRLESLVGWAKARSSRRAHRAALRWARGACHRAGRRPDPLALPTLRGARRLSSPNLPGDLYRQAQLRPLFVVGEYVALLGRGEAALRGQCELIERDVFGRLLDAALDLGVVLQRPDLGGDEAEHHDLVALGQEPQRLEAAGALAVVFEEIAVVVAVCQQVLRHWLVASGRYPGRAEIAAAHMSRDGHVRWLGFQRLVDGAGVSFLEMIDVKA